MIPGFVLGGIAAAAIGYGLICDVLRARAVRAAKRPLIQDSQDASEVQVAERLRSGAALAEALLNQVLEIRNLPEREPRKRIA